LTVEKPDFTPKIVSAYRAGSAAQARLNQTFTMTDVRHAPVRRTRPPRLAFA
jgi:hypothetical protein